MKNKNKKNIPSYFQWTYKKWYFWVWFVIAILINLYGLDIKNLPVAEILGHLLAVILELQIYFFIFYLFYKSGRKE